MKKYLAAFVLFGFFAAAPVFAQTGSDNQSLWNKLMGFLNPGNASEQTAATVVSQKNLTASKTSDLSDIFTTQESTTRSPNTTSNQGGCQETLTPKGLVNQTIRCNGRNWVAAGNLLNDGNTLGIGLNPQSLIKVNIAASDGAAIGALSYHDELSTIVALNQNAGPGISGQSQTGVGVRGFSYGYESPAIRGTNANHIGVEGIGAIGVAGYGLNETEIGAYGETVSGVGVKGFSIGPGTAILASKVGTDTVGHGFYQEGPNVKNNLEGSLSVNYLQSPPIINGVPVQVDGGVKILPSRVQSPCSATLRGTFWFTQGSNGVADSAQVCAKNANGSYEWKNIF